jgi:hypothetical protein
MKILMCGDVMGRSGREAIQKYIPLLREKWSLDLVVVNGENAARGFGISESNCKEFYEAGVDVITTGNHIWDQKEIISYIETDPHLLRPLNYPDKTPGQGLVVLALPNGKKVAVMNLMGRLFMDPLDDPFAALEKVLSTHKLGMNVAAILVDFHAETTSEKMAAAHIADGRITALIGTHTHVPTSDTIILPGGTAYQSDLGMTGDYDSVIGLKKEGPIQRFTRKFSTEKWSPAEGEASLCGVYIESDDTTGKALVVKPVRLGGILSQTEL